MSPVEATSPAPAPRRSGFRQRVRVVGHRLLRWTADLWNEIRPGPEARRGALWAILATSAVAAFIGGYYLQSGFGLFIDLAFAFAVALIGIPLVAFIAALLLLLLRKLPPLVSGFIFGCCAFIVLPWGPQLGIPLAIGLAVVEGFLGATIATFLSAGFRQSTLRKKLATAILFTASVAANIAFFVFLASDGSTAGLLQIKAGAGPAPAQLTAPNPAEPGPYAVKTLMYGSGTDLRRPEYGKSVAIRTPTVDASRFFEDFTGWKAALRRRYWGFGADKLPLNGRVWYPAGPGPFPLALIVHGNHNMAEFSDPGYEYLGTLLASRGFIFASLDENFLNSGLFHDPPKQQAVRGWMLLEHLRVWREWNNTPGNPFYRKVDVDNVALMGHSRGGEAAATAALFNRLPYYPDDAAISFHYGFPIKSIVAIAPADGQYRPAGQWRYIDNVNYLTIQGAHDADVSSFVGSRQFDHVRYTAGGPWFKAELYIYRANHGQFNTVWGRSDAGEPMGAFLNLEPLLPGAEQRRIAKIYISAFLEATLHNRREYIPIFRDYRSIRSWLPHTLYMSRFQDASRRVVANFNEDPDVTTTTVPGGRIAAENFTVWHEDRIPLRHGDRDYNGAFLGWNLGNKKKPAGPAPVYSISLPDEQVKRWNLGTKSALTLSAAVTDEAAPLPGKRPGDDGSNEGEAPSGPVDFTVELQTADGATASLPLSRFGELLPPFEVKFTKLEKLDSMFYKEASEPVFQSIDLPLAAFAAQTKGFDPSKVKTIRLKFDRTRSAVIILSQIGFEEE